ncbi:transcriptional regulator with XRE-family HTH domain [Chitinophaga skermanii]|uniref:Transcriptional regulator with XRE-family HTH domain n=1 Tax=Chitinophaga skermanii TaxID=331697 RepID=A0A327QHB3_9BACT|nr:helix-turn-helix domain-containing protein [Chitinophaga skermanii]RAJ03929.1 transcriptional regulator with XRE-family HTH domain [Chitinophaga skermanii]
MQFGDKLRLIRLTKNLTQQHVASQLGMSTTGYGNIERNGVKSVAFRTLDNITQVFEITVVNLFEAGTSPANSTQQKVQDSSSNEIATMKQTIDQLKADQAMLLRLLQQQSAELVIIKKLLLVQEKNSNGQNKKKKSSKKRD